MTISDEELRQLLPVKDVDFSNVAPYHSDALDEAARKALTHDFSKPSDMPEVVQVLDGSVTSYPLHDDLTLSYAFGSAILYELKKELPVSPEWEVRAENAFAFMLANMDRDVRSILIKMAIAAFRFPLEHVKSIMALGVDDARHIVAIEFPRINV